VGEQQEPTTVDEWRAAYEELKKTNQMHIRQKDMIIEARDNHILQLQNHAEMSDNKVNALASDNTLLTEKCNKLMEINQQLGKEIQEMPELKQDYEKFKKQLTDAQGRADHYRDEFVIINRKFGALKAAQQKILEVL
jgi:chromosome segregation ATPase